MENRDPTRGASLAAEVEYLKARMAALEAAVASLQKQRG
jgi:hypothetical protein